MFVKRAVRIPIVETVALLFRRISVPHRTLCFYILSRILRIIRGREVSVKFTEISTIITGLAEYVAYALRIVTQRADRTCRVTVQRYTTAIRIHTGQQHSTMGAAQRTVALSGSQHHRFTCESIYVRSMHGVSPEVYFISETFLVPEAHCLITVLVRKYINNIGMFRLFDYLLRSLATLCRKQCQASHQKIYRFHIYLSYKMINNKR